jgi:methionyl-tRNA formyltransferase
MKIVFMGSAAFAVPSLEALVRASHDIIEVVTQPDKPAGRGMRTRPCPVAEFARKNGLSLFQPPSVRKPAQIDHFKEIAPDLIVVVAYGKILPRELLDIPPRGCINVHASLLPKYRGAAPISWAIANGERETGVTTMFIGEELDSGDTLLSRATLIGDDETASQLHARLAAIGAELLVETIDGLAAGRIRAVPQDHSKATLAPLLRKDDGRIDWEMPARLIYNRVRAFTPWPGAFTAIGGRRLRIHSADVQNEAQRERPGTVIEAGERLCIACGRGVLELVEVQAEGGRRMSAADFLRGHRLAKGVVLG